MSISVLVVTRGEPHTPRFLTHASRIAQFLHAEFVIGCDRCEVRLGGAKVVPLDASACPMIETVLEQAVAACEGDWILRLDDDETVSWAMLGYLLSCDYTKREAIAFPRANLWGHEGDHLTDAEFWPDVQMRFSKRQYAIRRTIHEGAQKIDAVAPAMLLHHAFLIRGREGRREVARRYCEIQGVPPHDRYWPPDYMTSLNTSPVGDGFA